MDYIFYMSSMCAIEAEVSSYHNSIEEAMESNIVSRAKGSIISFFKMIGGIFKRIIGIISSAVSTLKSKIKKRKSSKPSQSSVNVKDEDDAKAKIEELDHKAEDYEAKIRSLEAKIKDMEENSEKKMEETRKKYSKLLGDYERDLNFTREQRNNYKAALNNLVSSTKITAENKNELNAAMANVMKAASEIVGSSLRDARSASDIRDIYGAVKYFNSKQFIAPDNSKLEKLLDYAKEFADERQKIGKTSNQDIGEMDMKLAIFFGETISNRLSQCQSIYARISNILEYSPIHPDDADQADYIDEADYNEAMRNLKLSSGYVTKTIEAFTKALNTIASAIH